ncbi:bifunctional riboflavin kinase/FAD synthetase [Calidifontibacter sp. DB0510]|uniref:Riboflavin biosynthesis protein n=1 Tax=Metallococcus carri TaxID=1656884 RepID=A0A967B457_9MICO|nr:bifunctional riboflavin kinase/FAD synthetase [Metallococcus carri]NHN54266.1 bifunctional riboflavin kinase/FAD synthetase [Metallococcus carri]NOP36894.1 bifunctional riboflavin kinase/FAD synthetase [Calidifontibacter sp. DB2511S]
MLQLTDLASVPSEVVPSVVTIGNFDGVHLGHGALLDEVVRQARGRSIHAIAVTFDPHPLRVLHPDRAPDQLCDLPTRLERIADHGVDVTLVLPFTLELAAMSPEEFVHAVFVQALGAQAVVVGRDTKFGAKNSGDVDTLRELGQKYGFEVTVLQDVGDDGRFSSTSVRAHLHEGDIPAAAHVLGRLPEVRGTVVRGHMRGRELGFPTANLSPESTGLVPADGVYGGWLVRDNLPEDHPDHRMPAAISVGTNPTFDDVPERTVEAYVLDRDDLDLYDEHVRVEFVQRLRGNVRFDSIEALIEQMTRDVDICRDLLQP